MKGGEIIALTGDLGAGKTTFVQGLAQGLGIETSIVSPTFIIMRTYQWKQGALCHVDLYRLADQTEKSLNELGIMDLWKDKNNIFVIEWAEKLPFEPSNLIKITIEQIDDETRKFTIV